MKLLSVEMKTVALCAARRGGRRGHRIACVRCQIEQGKFKPVRVGA